MLTNKLRRNKSNLSVKVINYLKLFNSILEGGGVYELNMFVAVLFDVKHFRYSKPISNSIMIFVCKIVDIKQNFLLLLLQVDKQLGYVMIIGY